MIRMVFLSLIFSLAIIACSKEKQNDTPKEERKIEYTKFNGSYKSFSDVNDLQMTAALAKGIEPMQTNADTSKYKDQLVRLPQELDFYKMDKLTHSVPYLIPDAADLLVTIGTNFRDSLLSKKLPPYKLIVTSVTRSLDDNVQLSKRNRNTSENSVHCYGTTIDISWKRFVKKGSDETGDIPVDRLKFVLAEVLHDLRQNEKCYIMHETKQACFHITVR